ncbi:kinase-like protein [Xylariaceae sp. FL0662B]|nr:kinase-like protein [Xylariaceae sp. FL0662B]
MSIDYPIAWICCQVRAQTEGREPPAGFYANGSSGVSVRRTSQKSLNLPLFPRQSMTIGRHKSSHISIEHINVSRKHFEIYSVIYDLVDNPNQSPLIYVRDRQSLGGTYVNGRLIGSRDKLSPSFLLSPGDVIDVGSYWQFQIQLSKSPELGSPLSEIQLKETNVFRGRYHLTSRILGYGAYGAVHLAVDVETARQLVCKIHDLDQIRRRAHSQDTIRRIMHETDILGKLKHPNILKFEYAFRSHHTIYTFTELATRGDLFSMYIRYDEFTERQIKFVIQQVVSALCYLRGVAHRDLKPENIFFTTGHRVILGDFGFAKCAASGRMASRIGTGPFMAPEICGGDRYGLGVDMWSLGIVMLCLLASHGDPRLFDLGRMTQSEINRWLNNIFEDSTNHKISEDGQNFVRACLILDPDRRMTACDAKGHSWFQQQPENDLFKEFFKENTKFWEAAHFIAPPVEELPEVEDNDFVPYGTLRHLQTKKGKRVYADSQPSPYFAQSKLAAPKRLKTSKEQDPQTIPKINIISSTPDRNSVVG